MDEKSLDLTFDPSPTDSDLKFIQARLSEFNRQYAGPDNHKPLAVFVRNPNKEIIAGLEGGTAWNWFFVKILWVKEEYRGQGLGGKIYKKAEEEAIKRGAEFVCLDTFDFQAPKFYKSLGFTEFGRLENCPRGYSRLYMCKKLSS